MVSTGHETVQVGAVADASTHVDQPGGRSTSGLDRLKRSTWLAAAGFALPALAYLLFIHNYGRNTLAADQWSDVGVISASQEHALTFDVLWSQWAVERMIFPRLVVLLLYKTTHLDTLVEMYLSAALLFVSTALIIVSHRRRSQATPLLYYCPVAIVMLSLVQYENTLWGFQLAWYMILAALGVSLWLLDRAELTWWVVALAIAAALVGSFSSFQGLLVWPACLLLLVYRSRPRPILLSWCAAGIAATAAYFFHFNFAMQSGNDFYAIEHPVAGIQFFLLTLGEVMGTSLSYSSTNYGVMCIGAVLLASALWLLYRYGLRRDTTGSGPIGFVLIVFGLLWALAVTLTQSSAGLQGAAVSRFTTYDLLIPIGCYLVVLPMLDRSRSLTVVKVAIYSVLGIVVVLGTVNGLAGGSYTLQWRILEAKVTANAQQATRIQLHAADPVDGTAIPNLAPAARQLGISQFNTGTAQAFDWAGLGAGRWATAQVPHVVPWKDLTDGQTVRVRGGGFRRRSTVVLSQCGVGIADTPPSLKGLTGIRSLPVLTPTPAALAACTPRTFATTSHEGVLNASVVVSARACPGVCYLAVTDPGRNFLFAATEIRFRPAS